MTIFGLIWNQYLYIPLLNFLIWLYAGYANYNLGLAIIILTIILRFILLPFTILEAKGKTVGRELTKHIKEIKKDYANDQVKQNLAIRLFLKKKKVRHWAKAISLTVQGLVLVLLYKVFITGVSSAGQLHLIYPGISRPDFVDTIFWGLNIAQRDLILPALVAGYLFAEILIEQWITKRTPSRQEQLFMIFFPAFSFLILSLLPAAKSIFILTSLIFSSIITILVGLIHLKTAANQSTAKK